MYETLIFAYSHFAVWVLCARGVECVWNTPIHVISVNQLMINGSRPLAHSHDQAMASGAEPKNGVYRRKYGKQFKRLFGFVGAFLWYLLGLYNSFFMANQGMRTFCNISWTIWEMSMFSPNMDTRALDYKTAFGNVIICTNYRKNRKYVCNCWHLDIWQFRKYVYEHGWHVGIWVFETLEFWAFRNSRTAIWKLFKHYFKT